ncbi:hypothetical protein BC940DRAFT_307235 [Gongronella butleri]|nr:hypothetical protein BC940DRAFT_307235 [Gongronella butleri]
MEALLCLFIHGKNDKKAKTCFALVVILPSDAYKWCLSFLFLPSFSFSSRIVFLTFYPHCFFTLARTRHHPAFFPTLLLYPPPSHLIMSISRFTEHLDPSLVPLCQSAHLKRRNRTRTRQSRFDKQKHPQQQRHWFFQLLRMQLERPMICF